MRQNGFSLVELVVVMAIAGILLAIATLNWSSMQKKSGIESEIKTIYTDLTTTRLDALYTKRGRKVVFTDTQYDIYANLTSTTPVSSKSLRYPLEWKPAGTSLTVTFDSSGLSTASADIPICVDPDSDLSVSNEGAVDSIVITSARIKLGKREGAECDTAHITQK